MLNNNENWKAVIGKKHLSNPKPKYRNVTYHNVTYDVNRNKWVACIGINGKNLESKRFNTEKEAALHVDYIIDKYDLIDRPKNII